MNPNPGTTRRALARGAHGALRPGRSFKTPGRGVRETPVPEPTRAARRSQPRRGQPGAPLEDFAAPLGCDPGRSSGTLRCGRCAPPRPLSGRVTPPVRRGPRLCHQKPRPVMRSSTFRPCEAPPRSSDGSASSRQKLESACRDLGRFLPLTLPGSSETPSLLEPDS